MYFQQQIRTHKARGTAHLCSFMFLFCSCAPLETPDFCSSQRTFTRSCSFPICRFHLLSTLLFHTHFLDRATLRPDERRKELITTSSPLEYRHFPQDRTHTEVGVGAIQISATRKKCRQNRRRATDGYRSWYQIGYNTWHHDFPKKDLTNI